MKRLPTYEEALEAQLKSELEFEYACANFIEARKYYDEEQALGYASGEAARAYSDSMDKFRHALNRMYQCRDMTYQLQCPERN